MWVSYWTSLSVVLWRLLRVQAGVVSGKHHGSSTTASMVKCEIIPNRFIGQKFQVTIMVIWLVKIRTKFGKLLKSFNYRTTSYELLICDTSMEHILIMEYIRFQTLSSEPAVQRRLDEKIWWRFYHMVWYVSS